MRSFKHYTTSAFALLILAAPAWAAGPSARELELQVQVHYYGDDVLEIDVNKPRGDAGGEIRVYRDRLSAAGGANFVKVALPKKSGRFILTPAIPWEGSVGYSIEVWRRDSLGAYRDNFLGSIWVPYSPQPIEPGHPFGPDTARPPADQLEAANDPAHDFENGFEGGVAALQIPDELHHAGELDFGDGGSDDPDATADGRDQLGQAGNPFDFGDGSTADDAANDNRTEPGLGAPAGVHDTGDGSQDTPTPDNGRDQLDQAGNPLDFGDGSTGSSTDDGRDRPDLDQPDGSQDTSDGNTNGSGNEPDCNGNGIPDRMEIMAYQPLDLNNNNELDECENLGDVTGDGRIDVRDLIRVMQRFGSCNGCIEDLNGTGTTDVSDLIIVLMRWQG